MAIRYETIKPGEPEKAAPAKAAVRPVTDAEQTPPEGDALPFGKPVKPEKKRKGR